MERLKRYLTEKGLSHEVFGKKIGVDRSMITSCINGRRTPSVATLIAMSHETMLTIDELLGHRPRKRRLAA